MRISKRVFLRKNSIAYWVARISEILVVVVIIAWIVMLPSCEKDDTQEFAELPDGVEVFQNTRYNVPLDIELQCYINNMCRWYDIDPVIVYAVIGQESNYQVDAIGDNGESFGLMQIQGKWHAARMEKLGVTDLLDPYQNVTVGVDILAEKIKAGNGIEWALMAYNGGNTYAYAMEEAGEVSDYVNGVLTIYKTIERL